MNVELTRVLVTVAVGLGATLVMDLWALFLKRAFKIPSPNYCFVGRWLRYMPERIFRHKSIAAAPPKAVRVHRWLDRALRHRCRIRVVARALGLSPMAARTHARAGDDPRSGHRRNSLPCHAAIVRTGHRGFEDAQSHAIKAAKPHEPRRVRARPIRFSAGHEFRLQGLGLAGGRLVDLGLLRQHVRAGQSSTGESSMPLSGDGMSSLRFAGWAARPASAPTPASP